MRMTRSGTTARMSSASIAAKGRRAGKSPWVERFGRAGLVAQGALYAVVSILAIDVALGSRKESPDKNGALRTIAEQPFGRRSLLTALAVGLARVRSSGSCRSRSSTARTKVKTRKGSPSARLRSPGLGGTAFSAG